MKEPDHHDHLKKIFLADMGMLPSRHADRLAPDALESLQVLGRYLLIEELGSGASGRVFSAMHQDLKKKVALKIYSVEPDTTKPTVDRFQREAVTAASLHHPNLVSVHDIGTQGRHKYIAMDLVEGVTLDQWLSRSSISLNDRLEVMEKIARAVSYSHGKGIIHRDIKPRNILITEQGEPIIVDFGLARSLFDDKKTHDGTLIGTPRYMAPEQLRGATSKLDKRTDLFALGVLLYEMVTSTLPFQGDSSAEIHESIVKRRMAAPGQLCSDLSGNLEAVILKALEPDPALRYQDGAFLADDLARLRAGDLAMHVESTVHMKLKRIASKACRHPLITSLSVLILIFVIWGGSYLSEQRMMERAFSIESAYNRISQQLEPLIELAEEQGYSLSVTEEEKQATLQRMEDYFDRSSDDTGVSHAFRYLLHDLLGSPRAHPIYKQAQIDYPKNPIIPLMRARSSLRHLADSLPWPGSNGISLYGKASKYFIMDEALQESLMQKLSKVQIEFEAAQALCTSMPLTAFEWIAELNHAYTDLSEGRLEPAIEKLEALQGIEELTAEIYIPLTLAYWTRHDFKRAVESAKRFAELRPDLILAKDTLALCYSHVGFSVICSNRSEAMEYLSSAMEVIKSISHDYLNKKRHLATIYLAMSRTVSPDPTSMDYARSAVDLFSNIIENGDPQFLDYFNRGSAYAAQRDLESLESAIEDFLHARLLKPDHPLTHLALAQAQILRLSFLSKTGTVRSEDIEMTRQTLVSLEKLLPDSPEVFLCKAQLELTIIGRMPSNSSTEDILVQYENIFHLVNEAIRLSPDMEEAHRLKFFIWFKIAEFSDASSKELELFLNAAIQRCEMGCRLAYPPEKIAGFAKYLTRKPPRALSLDSIALLLKTQQWYVSYTPEKNQIELKATVVKWIEYLLRFSCFREPQHTLQILEKLWHWALTEEVDSLFHRAVYSLQILCLDFTANKVRISDLLDDIEHLAARTEDPSKGRLMRARAYELVGSYESGKQATDALTKAVDAAEEALASDPQCSVAHLIRHAARRSLHDHEEPGDQLPKLDIQACNEHLNWCRFVAIAEKVDRKSLERALRLTKLLVEGDPNSILALQTRGMIALRAGLLEEARTSLMHARRRMDDETEADPVLKVGSINMGFLALVEHSAGQIDRAREYLLEMKALGQSEGMSRDLYYLVLMQEVSSLMEADE